MAGASFWWKRAPIWLRILIGLLIFPILWSCAAFGAAILLGSPSLGLLIATGLVACLVSWVTVRKSSTLRVAILAALVLIGYSMFAAFIVRYGGELSQPPLAEEIPSSPSAGASGGASGGGGGSGGSGFPPLMPELPLPSEAPQVPEVSPPVLPEASPPPVESSEDAVRFPAEQLPEFPWPPPEASASYVLPDRLIARYQTVGAVVEDILKALEQGGYVERSFFLTEAGGVALVTQLERINDDGSPVSESQRWPGGEQHFASTEGLFQFLRGLFYVDPGHYRVIVFVLQDLPFAQSSKKITAQEAQAWLTSGANVLPPDIARRPFGGGHCTVLIYEFASDGTKVRVVVSSLTGKEHLEKARVLAALKSAQ
jgi:hypothetical protein